MIPAPHHDYSPDPTLTAQQHRVITLLACGNSITQAAAAEDIHRNTVGYWRRTVPAFARELEFATHEQRLYWHEQATELAPQAIRILADLLTNPETSPCLRFRAASLILKMATSSDAAALKISSTLPAELAAMEGQTQSWHKEEQPLTEPPVTEPEHLDTPPQPAEPPVACDAAIVQSPQTSSIAQKCTRAKPPRLVLPPEPGRNHPCHCGSGVKYKRCCIGKTAEVPLFL